MPFPILGTPKPQFFDSSGAPLASGTLTVLDPTTDTNKASYPTYDAANASPPTSPNTNPITLDARGEPQNELWGLDAEDYKLVLKDSDGNTIWTVDDVQVRAVNYYPITAAETSAGVTPTNYQYEPGNVLRYGTNTTPGTTDMSTAAQAALNQSAESTGAAARFPSGSTIYIASAITLLSNTNVLIEKGCTVNCDERWTATAQTDITIEINGSLNLVQEPTDYTQIQSWTSAGENDRAFIEFFAGATGTTTVGGYKVFGTGSVTGPYSGTIGSTADWFTGAGIGGKGIGFWSAIDSEVSGLNVSAFKGEAIYARQPRKNVHFKRNYVFDNNANGLNFNSSVSFEDCSITDNVTKNCGQGIEASTGSIRNNVCYDTVHEGILTGDGAGQDKTEFINNTVNGTTQGYGFRISYAAGGYGTSASTNGYTGLKVIGNRVINADETGFYLNDLDDLEFSNNSVNGYDLGATGTLVGINIIENVTGFGAGNSVTQTVSSSGALVNLQTPASNTFNLTDTALNFQDGSHEIFSTAHYAAGSTGLVSDAGHRYSINNLNAAGNGYSLYGSVWQGGGTTTDSSIYAGIQFSCEYESGGAGGDIVLYARKSAGGGWSGLPAETFRITNDDKFLPYQNNRGEIGATALALANVYSGKFSVGSGGTQGVISAGNGSPEGSVTAVTGSLYLRLDGLTSNTLYVKEPGAANTGWVPISGLSGVTTLADDATPSVLNGELFKTGGTTTITDFDDGVVGQTIRILAAHSVTITDGTPIILAGGANFAMVATDTLTLTMFDDQVWQEVSRSVN